MADAVAPAVKQTEQSGPPWNIKNVSSWPGAFGAFKYSQSAVMVNLAAIVILFIISFLPSFAQPVVPSGLYLLIAYVIGLVVYVAQTKVYLASAKEKKLEVGDALKECMDVSLLLNMLGLGIIVGASVFLGLLAFIIPGLIILPRLVLAPYFLVDKKLDLIEAYKASWNTTRGHSWKVWGLVGAAIVMILPALTIIGIPVTIYLLFMYSAVGAVLYEYVNRVGPAKE